MVGARESTVAALASALLAVSLAGCDIGEGGGAALSPAEPTSAETRDGSSADEGASLSAAPSSEPSPGGPGDPLPPTDLSEEDGPMPGAQSVDVFADPPVATLATAVAEGTVSEVRSLAGAGTDINARGKDGVNLVQWAIIHRQPDTFTALLELGADPMAPGWSEQSAVHMAARWESADFLAILIREGADLEQPTVTRQETPLTLALSTRRDDNVGLLLAAGVDVDRSGRSGNTPLHHASLTNYFGAVVALLDAGADPTTLNAQGRTFQAYLHTTPERILSDEALAAKDQIAAILEANGVPVETPRR